MAGRRLKKYGVKIDTSDRAVNKEGIERKEYTIEGISLS